MQLIVRDEIVFKAPKSKVWDMLINPSITKQYMYGTEVLSDWGIGDPVLWKGKTESGEDIIHVKGEVVRYDPENEVAFTMFDPNSDIEDIPENYVELSYTLEEVEEGTKLTITQGDYATVAQGESRMADSAKGWGMVLPLMKEIAEK